MGGHVLLISYLFSKLYNDPQYQTQSSINHSPEALGIVPGAIFLICLMFCLVGFATNHPQKVREMNSFDVISCTSRTQTTPYSFYLLFPAYQMFSCECDSY